MRYVLFILISVSSFHNVNGQAKKVVFPITIVIYSGIDTIYCFKDSLSAYTKLIVVNTETEFKQTIYKTLETIENLDSIYKPMMRLCAIWSENFGTDKIPWERVSKYGSRLEKKVEMWYRNESAEKDNYFILKKLIKDRLNK
jgi:hypothetical protein